jgi:hypothetical protein
LLAPSVKRWVDVDQLKALRGHRFKQREIVPKENLID